MATVKDLLETKGREVWSVSIGDSVMDALKVLAARRIGVVPVMDGASVAGVFSERDFARLAANQGGPALDRQVSEVMTPTVYFTTPEEGVEACMSVMTEKKVRHLPVIENSRMVGLISIGDIVKELLADREAAIRSLENYIVGGEFRSLGDMSRREGASGHFAQDRHQEEP